MNGPTGAVSVTRGSTIRTGALRMKIWIGIQLADLRLPGRSAIVERCTISEPGSMIAFRERIEMRSGVMRIMGQGGGRQNMTCRSVGESRMGSGTRVCRVPLDCMLEEGRCILTTECRHSDQGDREDQHWAQSAREHSRRRK